MKLFITSFFCLLSFSLIGQESPSNIHLNLASIMGQGIQVGIGKKINNKVIGLTIADLGLSTQNFDNNGGGMIGNVINAPVSNSLNTNKISLGAFIKKYKKNNIFTFSAINGSYTNYKTSVTLDEYLVPYGYFDSESVYISGFHSYDRVIDYDNSKASSYSIGFTSGVGYVYKINELFNLEAGLFGNITFNNSFSKIDRGVSIDGFVPGYWQSGVLVTGYEFSYYEADFLEESASDLDINLGVSVSLVFNP